MPNEKSTVTAVDLQLELSVEDMRQNSQLFKHAWKISLYRVFFLVDILNRRKIGGCFLLTSLNQLGFNKENSRLLFACRKQLCALAEQAGMKSQTVCIELIH